MTLDEAQGLALLRLAQQGAGVRALSGYAASQWGIKAGRGAVRSALARAGARYQRGRWERP